MEHPQDQPINEDSHEHLPEEQEPLLELGQTLGEIDKSIKGLDGTNLTPEQQSRVSKIKENVLKSTRKFLKVVRMVAITGVVVGSITLAVGTVDYKMTHPNIQETTSQSGEVIYTHPDERTTHYLNILAGKDRFTKEDLVYAGETDRTAKDLNILAGLEKFTGEDVDRIATEEWEKQVLESSTRPLPTNIKEMSSLELATLYFKDPKFNIESGEAERYAQEFVIRGIQMWTEKLNEQAEFRSSTGRDIFYRLVWQLEQEGGNPQIRFKAEKPNFNLAPGSKEEDQYSSMRNTLYIGVDSLMSGRGVVYEMSHGKQFKDNPLGYYFLEVRDLINVYLRSGFSAKGRAEEYRRLYDKSGSLEYQAHQVIQPDLEKRYDFMPYLKQQKDDGK